ncbi:hypothetical protein V6N12_056910 [Hibiscus sabdariffa]|uniref:Uncharacterized protein n=1 Tax=Hibiscus sabdariffa TaxID=183260 RepID=A0ABR2DCS5_9ROSI
MTPYGIQQNTLEKWNGRLAFLAQAKQEKNEDCDPLSPPQGEVRNVSPPNLPREALGICNYLLRKRRKLQPLAVESSRDSFADWI